MSDDVIAWNFGDEIPAPLELYRCTVIPDWIDYNEHMTEAAYLIAFGCASDALFRYVGDNEAYRAVGHSFYTVETHIVYEREVSLNEPLRIATQILDVDEKRLHIHHSMYHAYSGDRLATTEQMLVHVDMRIGRSTAILPNVATALKAIYESHRSLAVPSDVGRTMKIDRKPKND